MAKVIKNCVAAAIPAETISLVEIIPVADKPPRDVKNVNKASIPASISASFQLNDPSE